MYDFRKEWEHDIFTSRTDAKKITAFFKNGQFATYTMNTYGMLITDKQIDFICDSDIGELITEKERQKNYRYLPDHIFSKVQVPKNKTVFIFGARFEIE